jgi:hypothetical protein
MSFGLSGLMSICAALRALRHYRGNFNLFFSVVSLVMMLSSPLLLWLVASAVEVREEAASGELRL